MHFKIIGSSSVVEEFSQAVNRGEIDGLSIYSHAKDYIDLLRRDVHRVEPLVELVVVFAGHLSAALAKDLITDWLTKKIFGQKSQN